jgi:class 3 adenylate cyclase
LVVPEPNSEHRKLAAIMFTDMVGYSALSQRNEPLALELLAEQQRLLRSQFPTFNGREVKATGDGFLVEFPSALDDTQCAVAIQRAVAGRNSTQPTDRHFQVRIGTHVGDVVYREEDMYGDGVNITARIEPLATPGGICVTRAVFKQIENKVPHKLVQLSRPELKNISAKVEVYRLVLHGVAAPARASGAKRILATAVLVVILLNVVLFLKFGLWDRSSHAEPANLVPRSVATERDQQSVAVLPFLNLSADKADEYLSDGMTEELLNALARVQGLRVPGRSSSFAFKGRNEEDIFRKMGEQLHVATVLEGSVPSPRILAWAMEN